MNIDQLLSTFHFFSLGSVAITMAKKIMMVSVSIHSFIVLLYGKEEFHPLEKVGFLGISQVFGLKCKYLKKYIVLLYGKEELYIK